MAKAATKKAKKTTKAAAECRTKIDLRSIVGEDNARYAMSRAYSDGKHVYAMSSSLSVRVESPDIRHVGIVDVDDLATGKVTPVDDGELPHEIASDLIDTATGEMSVFFGIDAEAIVRLADLVKASQCQGLYFTVNVDATSGDYGTTGSPIGIIGKTGADNGDRRFSGVASPLKFVKPILVDQMTPTKKGHLGAIDDDTPRFAQPFRYDPNYKLSDVIFTDTWVDISSAVEKVRSDVRYAPYLCSRIQDLIETVVNISDAKIEDVRWFITEFINELREAADTPLAKTVVMRRSAPSRRSPKPLTE